MEGLAVDLVDNDPNWLPAGSYLKMLETNTDQTRQGEKVLGAANVEALSVAATGAIEQMTKARDALVALTADTRGDQALTRANACLAQIQSAATSVAQTSPSVSPSAGSDDEVTVPNLSAFQSITEIKAVLAHAGLKAALIAAKEKPPSKEKEFKVAGQSPAPDTKVKKGSTVTISFYEKFEGTETATATSPAATSDDPFVGKWSGNLTCRDGKPEKKTWEIQKRGEGYVIVVPGVDAMPLKFEGGNLVWQYTFDMTVTVGVNIGKAKTSATGKPEKIIITMTMQPAGKNLAVRMVSKLESTGKTEGDCQGTFTR
jgi:hypothetical protein